MKSGTKYFKDGNVEVFGFINAITWKRMTDKERAHWTPFSEAHEKPIPEDVLNFTAKNPPPGGEPCAEDSRCRELEAKISELSAQLDKYKPEHAELLEENAELKKKLDLLIESSEVLRKSPKEISDDLLQKIPDPLPDGFDETLRKQLLEECRKRGIKTTHNMKLETLQKKLKDADNTE